MPRLGNLNSILPIDKRLVGMQYLLINMNTQQIDQRMIAILTMFKLSHKKLTQELQDFIYQSLKLAYLDGKTEGIGQTLKPNHIEGLSGVEEYLALKD